MYQLTSETLCQALDELCKSDPRLQPVRQQFGSPPLWGRPQNFATIVHVILEQKVSLSSAQAVMQRVRTLCPSMQPAQFLALTEAQLRKAGLSERKVSYCFSVAEALATGQLKLAALRLMKDEEVIDVLTTVRGIGPWTAGVYLMMALRRCDAWASGDRALAVSYSECIGTADIPEYAYLDRVAEAWRPYRGAAARLLWHAYLQRRNRM